MIEIAGAYVNNFHGNLCYIFCFENNTHRYRKRELFKNLIMVDGWQDFEVVSKSSLESYMFVEEVRVYKTNKDGLI